MPNFHQASVKASRTRREEPVEVASRKDTLLSSALNSSPKVQAQLKRLALLNGRPETSDTRGGVAPMDAERSGNGAPDRHAPIAAEAVDTIQLITQRKSTAPVTQLVKLNLQSGSVDMVEADVAAFAKYLCVKLKLGASKPNIQKCVAAINGGEYDGLGGVVAFEQYYNKFMADRTMSAQDQQVPVVSHAMGSASSSAVKKIAEPLSFTGEICSFSTNIKSGVQGLFDIHYSAPRKLLIVTVKMTVPSITKCDLNQYLRIAATLTSMQEFWSGKASFKKVGEAPSEHPTVAVGESIPVVVTIVPLTEGGHFKYEDLDDWQGSRKDRVLQIANPHVLREQSEFATRSVEMDQQRKVDVDQITDLRKTQAGRTEVESQGILPGIDMPQKQVSSHHEFGHVLGLHEEYNMNTHLGDETHHRNVMNVASKQEFDARKEGEVVVNSIMGIGDDLMAHHFAPILKALTDLMHSNVEFWQIVLK